MTYRQAPWTCRSVKRIGVTALVSALAASGCQSVTGRGTSERQSVIVRVGLALPDITSSPDLGVTQVVANLTRERLVGLEHDGRVTPRLAESWRVSPDQLTWRFTLRPGLRLHDGTPLDANVSMKVIARALEPANRADLAPGLRDVIGLQALANELEIRLARPSALLLEDLSEISVVTPNGAGAGPFVVESRTRERTILKKFDEYYLGRPYVDRVDVRPYPSARRAWAEMLRGDLDMLYDADPDAVEFVKDVSSLQAFSFLRPYVYLLGFNTRHPVLHRAEVRRALSLALDRNAIVEGALRSFGMPADGHIWPLHWAHDPTVRGGRFDPADASERLTRMGYRLPEVAHASMSGHQPSRLRFTCLVWQGQPLFERMALLVQKQLFDIGVDMAIEAVSVEDFLRRGTAGRFDAFLIELIGGKFVTWPYRFWHSPTSHAAWFQNGYDASDDVLDRARRASTEPELRRALRDFQSVIEHDPPAAFLAWGRTYRAVSRRFVVPAEPERDVISSLWRWRPSQAVTPERDAKP